MAKRRSLKHALKFIVIITIISIPLSTLFDSGNVLLSRIPWYLGILILIFIVLFGAFFDMIGVAAAAAKETPFHAMASKKIPGARFALLIVRNAERVASICSDVIGDIAGVLSGATASVVGARIVGMFDIYNGWGHAIIIAITVLATALTIGGKALGKTIAVYFPTTIILNTARVIEFVLRVVSKKWRER